MKKILFISWDGPQTSYMEGLFMPIFYQIQQQDPSIQFHCLQFSWANEGKAQQEAAKKYQLPYTLIPIYRKPIPSLGSFYSLLQGHKVIKNYVKQHQIDVLMPRSNFPAFMVNRTRLDLPIIFDADGLPIEERIEFSGLKRNSIFHRFLESIEKNIMFNAKIVLVRSEFGIDYFTNKYKISRKKFFVISNGRDKEFFQFNLNDRNSVRKKYGLKDKVLVYCGSIDGKKYLFEEIIKIFIEYRKINNNAKLMVLSGSNNLLSKIPNTLKKEIILKSLPYKEVPKYLSASDIAIGIIDNTLSMKAVSAIKLGEYLLMGLPTIFSKDIGDSNIILKNLHHAFLFNKFSKSRFQETVSFIKSQEENNLEENRNAGINFFSLEKSAEDYLKAIETIKH